MLRQHLAAERIDFAERNSFVTSALQPEGEAANA
jgi:hypothetical protein